MMETNCNIDRFNVSNSAFTKLSEDSGMPVAWICTHLCPGYLGDNDDLYVIGSDYDDDTWDGEIWVYDCTAQSFFNMNKMQKTN